MFVDFNQNAKDRTVASAYSVRPLPDARVSTPLDWDEVRDSRPRASSRCATVLERFAERGDPAAGIDDAVGGLDGLLRLAEELGPAEKPPKSSDGSGRRQSTMPLIEIARTKTKPEALEALERWKAQASRRGAAAAAGRRARRRHARIELALVPHPREPAARARGAAAGAGGRSRSTTTRGPARSGTARERPRSRGPRPCRGGRLAATLAAAPRRRPDHDGVEHAHARAHRSDGEPAMLKLAHTEEEVRGADLLAALDGHGAARVLERNGAAMLLERATGGRDLVRMVETGDDDEATRIICDAADRIHAGIRRRARRRRPARAHRPADLVPPPVLGRRPARRRSIAAVPTWPRALLDDPRDPVVLHGDLHHGNVLDFGERGWLAIDPKGLLGEAAVRLLQPAVQPVARAGARARPTRTAVRGGRGRDRPRPARLADWLVAWCALSSTWFTLDDDPRLADSAAAIGERALDARGRAEPARQRVSDHGRARRPTSRTSVLAHGDARARGIRHPQLPAVLAVAEHERLGEVLGEVARRRRRVAGQREARQRGERDVRGAADAGLEHAAAPDGHVERAAGVVHAQRLEVAAHAAGLDVDDRGRAALDRVDGRRTRRGSTRRGTPASSHVGGEAHVRREVLLGERLLDEQQVELVEPGEQRDVVGRVRRVRVDLQQPARARAPRAPRRPARGPSRA